MQHDKTGIKRERERNLTVLPHRSLGSTAAPLWSSNSTTSVKPWQEATCRAVLLSISLKFTFVPESNSSLMPSKSPSLARYISRTVGSIPPRSSKLTEKSCRSGARDDCFPRVNLIGGLASIPNQPQLSKGFAVMDLQFKIVDYQTRKFSLQILSPIISLTLKTTRTYSVFTSTMKRNLRT